MKTHMKNFLLLISFLTLSVSTALAQPLRSARFQEQSLQLPPSISKTMQKAGLDIAATPPLSPQNNRLLLDSTKTFYAYDPTGSLDSTPLFRTIYDYHIPNVRYELEEQFDGLAWTPLYRTAYRHDDLERLVEVVAEYFDPETSLFYPDSRLLAYPRGNSMELLDSFIVYGWAPEVNDWHPFLANYNTFEGESRLVETISIFDLFGFPTLFKDVLYCDDNGDNFLTEGFIVEEGEDIFIGKTETAYLNHRPIEVTEFIYNGFQFEPIARQVMDYTSFGALELQLNFAWDFEAEDWLLTDKNSFAYDDQRRLSAHESETFDEQGAFYELTTYAYIDGDDLALETIYYKDGTQNSWELDTRTYYYYTGATAVPNQPVSQLPLRLFPNPTTDLAVVQLKAEADVQLYDAAGQLRRSFRLLPGQAIDLSGLPAGLYFCRLSAGAAIQTRRILVGG